MTEVVVVKLPDDLAQRAKNAGLLSDSAIQRLLEEAMRREAGRRLLEATRAGARGRHWADERGRDRREVKAARAERRARQAKPDPKQS